MRADPVIPVWLTSEERFYISMLADYAMVKLDHGGAGRPKVEAMCAAIRAKMSVDVYKQEIDRLVARRLMACADELWFWEI